MDTRADTVTSVSGLDLNEVSTVGALGGCLGGVAVHLFAPPVCVVSAQTATNCSEDNGGCDHECTDSGDGLSRSCSCIHGYDLQDDSRSCQPKGERSQGHGCLLLDHRVGPTQTRPIRSEKPDPAFVAGQDRCWY